MNTNSISLNFVDHDHTWEPCCPEDFNASSVQDPNFEDLMSCSGFLIWQTFTKRFIQFCQTE